MRHKESEIQRNCIKWIRLKHPELTCFAIPNGGGRSEIEGAILKGEGVLAGVADLFLMRASFAEHGLFIEIKTEKGRQTDSQKAFEAACAREDYGYVVVRSVSEFMSVVENYLKR